MDDLAHLFALTVSPLELIVRGTAVYWFLYILFRFVLRRDVGSMAMADVLLVVLIADAAQNAMAGEYKSITDGCLLVATIAFWNYLLDWASFRFDAVRRIVEPPPLLLVDDGRLILRNMRRQLVSTEELRAKMRENGIERWEDVHKAYMEADGEISVLQRKSGGEARDESQQPAGSQRRKPL
jgi:uncharacterized membrane protein YcaP (DUF421 family)